jgi:hypothetical protein
MARLKTLEREEVAPEVREICDKYLKERGNVPNAFKTWAQIPSYLTTLIAHYRAVRFTGNLRFSETDIIELASTIGMFNHFNRFTTALRIDPSGSNAPYGSFVF